MLKDYRSQLGLGKPQSLELRRGKGLTLNMFHVKFLSASFKVK